jgi:hypothetical protein
MRLFLVLLFAGCAPQAPAPGAAGPAEAVQDFAAAVQRGDSGIAWGLLSARTQAEATRLARAGRPDAGDGRAMLFGSALPLSQEMVLGVDQGDASAAEVRTGAPDGGAGRTFHVVREGDRWRIDLALSR